jgi:hypothetical protein
MHPRVALVGDPRTPPPVAPVAALAAHMPRPEEQPRGAEPHTHPPVEALKAVVEPRIRAGLPKVERKSS